jgi:mannose-6-phosphate isomerase-like protein (cupin superfamily)
MTVKICSFLVLALLVVSGQETAPDGFKLWTGDSTAHMAQELKTEAAASPQHLATRKLADFQNDLFMLAHREADGVAEWHETQADIFFVQSGSATLLVGGNMVGAETTEPHEKRKGTIEGGVRHKLSPGDIIRIPPRTPHQLLLDGSKEFTYFVIKVKGY